MLRTLLGGLLALPLCLTGPNLAWAQAGGLPGVFGSSNTNAPVYLAQSADPRIAQLEEQIRQLSGLVEELNFQVLQMQDQLQRMQEDNEFRFQELEQGRAGNAGSDQRSEATPPATQDAPATAPAGDLAAVPSLPQDGSVLGAPPRDFGSITFDGQGNVRQATQEPQPLPPATGQAPVSSPAPADDTTVAALPPANDADELYRNSYEFILSGDYGTAEQGFRDLIDRFPGAEIEPDAHFWLGESLLAQEKPREAAEVFLSASRSFPQSRKAPEMLYKLGVSLVALNQRDVACATFAEVSNRYPQASDAIQERVRQEQALASC